MASSRINQISAPDGPIEGYNAKVFELLLEKKIRTARSNFWDFRQLVNPDMKVGWFQQEVARELQYFIGRFLAGHRPKLIIEAPPQHGKLISDDTPVLTTNGWKRHGDLRLGDKVFHPSGEAIKVVAITDKNPSNMRVELTNGEVIYCHERHEWTVYNRNKKRYETLETAEMLKPGKRSKDRNPLHTGTEGKRGCHYVFQIPPTYPIKGHPQELPVDPYTLGAWLGDGSQTKPTLTHDKKDKAIIERVNSGGYPTTRVDVHKTTGVISTSFGRKLSDGLRELGIYTREYGVRIKRIPDIYLTAPIQDRLNLLAGLIDTDGFLYKRNGRVVFTTADVKLANTFIELISTFGWNFSKVTEQPRTSSSAIVGKREYFVIGFNPTLQIPCALPRKRDGRLVYKKRRVAIKSISYDPQGKVGHCIQVDSPDGLYLVGQTMQPTHNSIQVIDVIGWLAGKDPNKKTIYTSFSERLGVRANLRLQRMYSSSIYQRIFPDTKIITPGSRAAIYQRNKEFLEYIDKRGSFRNTTVNGAITGETLDLGIMDDPIKGRKEANSLTTRNSAWDWFTDDFFTRFNDDGAFLGILTRWHVDDPIGRFIEKYPDVKVLSYPALAKKDEKHRKVGEPLFPEHKSLEFLLERKAIMDASSWESLYQQSPFIAGGGIIKGADFGRYKILPKIEYRACFGDTAQKAKQANDYQVAQCWGLGIDGNLYLIDQMREKFEAYELETRFPDFWNKQKKDTSSPLRYFGIEDKSSGTELIQKMKNTITPRIPVKAIPRSIDKYTRVQDVLGYQQSGFVYLPENAPWVHDFIAECEAFTADDAHDHDDQIDPMCDAISRMLNKVGGREVRVVII